MDIDSANAEDEIKYQVRFQQNRTYELYINRKMLRFNPHEMKELSEADVESDDFQRVAKLFDVREVKA